MKSEDVLEKIRLTIINKPVYETPIEKNVYRLVRDRSGQYTKNSNRLISLMMAKIRTAKSFDPSCTCLIEIE